MPWSIRLALAACFFGLLYTPVAIAELGLKPLVWLSGLGIATFLVQLALAFGAGQSWAAGLGRPGPPSAAAGDRSPFFASIDAVADPDAPRAALLTPLALPAPLAAILRQDLISPAALAALNIAIEERDYVTVGGGIGSFVWVDYLRACGVSAQSIAVVGPEARPYARFGALCRNSQIGERDRLRSSSDACPDNLWGWPGYGVREILRRLGQGKWDGAARVAWQLFAEPIGAVTYVPLAGDVYRALDAEARRIGWGRMWRPGWAEAIRSTDDGRYLVVYRALTAQGLPALRFVLARFVHLATGYPSLRRLPFATAYRPPAGQAPRVVHVYDLHEHMYIELEARGGTVLLQGRGIAASRVLERLHQIRRLGRPVEVVHLLREPRAEGSLWEGKRRRSFHHWELQPFNWPKAAWGGEHRERMAAADEAGRRDLARRWGGTTTAPRPEFEQPISSGLSEGWYHPRFGQIERVEAGPDGRPEVSVTSPGPVRETSRLQVSFVVDATGLDTERASDPLWGDLERRYGLRRTSAGGQVVSDSFELQPLRQPHGAVFVSGVAAAGNAFAPVDSFLGMQYAAQRSVEQLSDWHAPGVHRLGIWRSLTGWLRWATGRSPS